MLPLSVMRLDRSDDRTHRWLHRRVDGLQLSVVAALYLVFGLWTTRPLITHLNGALPYGTVPELLDVGPLAPSDGHQLLFYNWLFIDNLASARSPMANVYEFGPLDPSDLHTLGAWGFPMQLLFACLLPFGMIAAYNLVLLLSYPLTGLAQYALLRQLGAARPAAFLGGLVLAFALPRTLQMAGGHANGFLYLGLPLLLRCIWSALSRTSVGAALGAAVVLVATALGEWHQFYFTSLLCALYVPLCLWWTTGLAWRRHGVVLALIAAGELTGAAYVLWLKNTTLARSTAAAGRAYAEAAQNSPSAIDLVRAEHAYETAVWAGSQLEPSVYLGAAWLTILGACLVISCTRRALRVQSGMILAHLALAALFAWLAVGPSLDRIVPLYRFLYDWLPYWNYSRVPGRMIYIPLCLGSIAFALALTAVLQRPRWTPVYFLAGAFVIWDLVGRAPALLLGRAIQSSPALESLAALDVEPGGALLYLPIHPPGSSQAAVWELYTTHVRQPYLNGYSPAAPAAAHDVLHKLERINRGRFDDEIKRVLSELGVRYIAYNDSIKFLRPPEVAPNLAALLDENPHLERLMRAEGFHVYALRAPR